MKKFYYQLIQSLKYSSFKKYRSYFVNPEIKEIMQGVMSKKRKEDVAKIEEDLKVLERLRNSYEYKVFEHYNKIEFESNKKLGSDFLKYCEFKQFDMKEKWTKGIFFTRYFPKYHDYHMNKVKKIMLFLVALILFKVGWNSGFKHSMLFDVIKENVLDVRSEDQLFDILINKKQPVLVLYYTPGDISSFSMMFAQGLYKEKYPNVPVHMAKVNCKYNLDLCIKKVHYLSMPQFEMMYPPLNNEEIQRELESGNEIFSSDGVRRFPVIPCRYNRSIEGIEGFLMSQGIVPDEYNPIYNLNKAAVKYENSI
jgi:hypothetical protein